MYIFRILKLIILIIFIFRSSISEIERKHRNIAQKEGKCMYLLI